MKIKEVTLIDATMVNSPHKPHLPKVLEIAGEREEEREEAQKQQESVLISKRRCFVEHTFGGIHLWFGGGVTRYVCVERTHTQGILEALAYNIKRMLRIPLSDE